MMKCGSDEGDFASRIEAIIVVISNHNKQTE